MRWSTCEEKAKLPIVCLDILHAIEGIERYTAGMSFADFLQDQKTRDAVVWNIALIGEASKRIPKSLRQKYKDLP